MVKKKDGESKDLTRLEDISEFLHQEDQTNAYVTELGCY